MSKIITRKDRRPMSETEARTEVGVARRTLAILSAMALTASGIGLVLLNRPSTGMSQGANVLTGADAPATHVPLTDEEKAETVNVSGTVSWNDEDNAQGERPDSAKVQLVSSAGDIVGKTTASASDGWSYSFSDLPKYDGMDREIAYHVSAPGEFSAYATELNGNDIMNSQAASSMANVAVNVIWDDNNNQDALRPDSVQVELDRTNYDANDESKIATLGNDTNKWSYTFTHIPQASADDEWFAAVLTDETTKRVYTFDIEQVGDGANRTINITCSHKPYVTKLLLRNVWHDDGSAEAIAQRPSSVEMTVTSSRGDALSYTVTKDDMVDGEQWAKEVELPRFDGVNEIEYEIVPATIGAGDEAEEPKYEENYTPDHDKSEDVEEEIGTDDETVREGIAGDEPQTSAKENEAVPADHFGIALFVQGQNAQLDSIRKIYVQGDNEGKFEDVIFAAITEQMNKMKETNRKIIGWAYTDAAGALKKVDNNDDKYSYYELTDGDVRKSVPSIIDFAKKNKGKQAFVYIMLRFDSPYMLTFTLHTNSGTFQTDVDGIENSLPDNRQMQITYPENQDFPYEKVRRALNKQGVDADFAGWRISGTVEKPNEVTVMSSAEAIKTLCTNNPNIKTFDLTTVWKAYHLNYLADGFLYVQNANPSTEISGGLVKKEGSYWDEQTGTVTTSQFFVPQCIKYGYAHDIEQWIINGDKEYPIATKDLRSKITQKFDFDPSIDVIRPVYKRMGATYVWVYAKNINNGDKQSLIFFDPEDAIYDADSENITISIGKDKYQIPNVASKDENFTSAKTAYKNNDLTSRLGGDVIGIYDPSMPNNSEPGWRQVEASILNTAKVIQAYRSIADNSKIPMPENISGWFAGFEALEEADLSGFNMNTVNDVSDVFKNNPLLAEVKIPVDFTKIANNGGDISNIFAAANKMVPMTVRFGGTQEPSAALRLTMLGSAMGAAVTFVPDTSLTVAAACYIPLSIKLPMSFTNYIRSGFVVNHKADSTDKRQGRTLGDKKIVLTVHHRAKKIYGNTPAKPSQIAYVPSGSAIDDVSKTADTNILKPDANVQNIKNTSVGALGDNTILMFLGVVVVIGMTVVITHRRNK